MLTEQRYQIILDLLKEKKSVTATELKEILDTSESTVRRDITALHKAGKLIKDLAERLHWKKEKQFRHMNRQLSRRANSM